MNDPHDSSTPAADATPDTARPAADSVLVGFAIGLGILLSYSAILLVPHATWLVWGLFTPGFTQWIVVIPLVLWLRRRGRTETAKGLLIIAGSACIINTACCGLFLTVR